MRVKEAIRRADELRPNAISEERKAAWVLELEGRLALARGVPYPSGAWPDDFELTMPPPYDQVYERYLCAMTDLANQETDLYANDMALFETTFSAAVAWWRREHIPERGGSWKSGI